MPDRNGLMLPQPVVSVTEYLQGRHAFQTITDLTIYTHSVLDVLDFTYFLSRRGWFDRLNYGWQQVVWKGQAAELAREMHVFSFADFRSAQILNVGRPLRDLIHAEAAERAFTANRLLHELDIDRHRQTTFITGDMQIDIDRERTARRIEAYAEMADIDEQHRRGPEHDELERKAATTHLFEQIADVRQGRIALPDGREITLSEDDKHLIIEGLLTRLAEPTELRAYLEERKRRGRANPSG